MMNLMSDVNFETYVERMAEVKDKNTLLELIPKGAKVLDYGCGSGVLAKNFSPYFYVGYDLERHMVQRARKDNPGYYFTHDIRDANNIDAVIYSSVLHEVYSYNNNSRSEVVKALVEGAALLNDGGNLIIRDGVMGEGFDKIKANVRLIDPNNACRFLHYLNEGPQDFSNIILEGNRLLGTLEGVVNFLNVYTWGWQSAERERNERVNFATINEWRSIVEDAGLKIVEEKLLLQESYFQHLSDIIDVDTLPQQWETKILLRLEPSK